MYMYIYIYISLRVLGGLGTVMINLHFELECEAAVDRAELVGY